MRGLDLHHAARVHNLCKEVFGDYLHIYMRLILVFHVGNCNLSANHAFYDRDYLSFHWHDEDIFAPRARWHRATLFFSVSIDVGDVGQLGGLVMRWQKPCLNTAHLLIHHERLAMRL